MNQRAQILRALKALEDFDPSLKADDPDAATLAIAQRHPDEAARGLHHAQLMLWGSATPGLHDATKHEPEPHHWTVRKDGHALAVYLDLRSTWRQSEKAAQVLCEKLRRVIAAARGLDQ